VRPPGRPRPPPPARARRPQGRGDADRPGQHQPVELLAVLLGRGQRDGRAERVAEQEPRQALVVGGEAVAEVADVVETQSLWHRAEAPWAGRLRGAPVPALVEGAAPMPRAVSARPSRRSGRRARDSPCTTSGRARTAPSGVQRRSARRAPVGASTKVGSAGHGTCEAGSGRRRRRSACRCPPPAASAGGGSGGRGGAVPRGLGAPRARAPRRRARCTPSRKVRAPSASARHETDPAGQEGDRPGHGKLHRDARRPP
jgi:hypothetical protein